MKQSYEAMAESLREQARRYVSVARRSNSLRDIVRLIATASTLEHSARKLCSSTDVDLSDLAKKLNAGANLTTECSRLSAEAQATHAVLAAEAVGPIISPRGDVRQTDTGAVTDAQRSAMLNRGDSMPIWKLFAMLPRPGGES